MTDIISVQGLEKTYDNGFSALKSIDLTIKQGEIFALLGPNGAGKTTLISTICGLVNPTRGTVEAGGFNILSQYKSARGLIGLVPQELTTDAFETVWATVNFSRGLFGKKPNKALIEQILKDLSLWDKKDNQLRQLSGGMKRRVMIAKALSHEPKILFLDEPTAGVDVELRRDMWELVRKLRENGVTIILTTHYIEEAEEMADRIGVINSGEIILVDEKDALMKRLGRKTLTISLYKAISSTPDSLKEYPLQISEDGLTISYEFDAQQEHNGISHIIASLQAQGIEFTDIQTQESSLEDIFVNLVHKKDDAA